VDIILLDALGSINGATQSNLEGKLQIFDARPWLNAQGNALLGGGFENNEVYTNCDFTFCDIANIHEVKKAHHAMSLMALTPQAFGDKDSYLKSIDETGYYQLISTILKAVNMVVECIVEKKQNVLVHCSDGWDRTPQMCSLAQLVLHEHYRTIEGFCDLIEKDWLQFGHRFALRSGIYA
jgi:hypothetical protein